MRCVDVCEFRGSLLVGWWMLSRSLSLSLTDVLMCSQRAVLPTRETETRFIRDEKMLKYR